MIRGKAELDTDFEKDRESGIQLVSGRRNATSRPRVEESPRTQATPATASEQEIADMHVEIARIGTLDHPVSTAPLAWDVGPSRHGVRAVHLALFGLAAALAVGAPLFAAYLQDEDADETVLAATPLQITQSTSTSGDLAAAQDRPEMEPGEAVSIESLPLELEPTWIIGRVADEPDSPAAAQSALTERVKVRGVESEAPSATASEMPEGDLSAPFDRTAADRAVTQAGLGASDCGPRAVGAAGVAVTFAPSGRVTRALVTGGPLKGTPEGSCIARRLRDVNIPAFDGNFTTVNKTLLLR